MPRAGQRRVSPTRTAPGGEQNCLARGAGRGGSGGDRWQAPGARRHVGGEHADPVRHRDGLERPGRPRVDLDDPRALAVPHEVETPEEPFEREGGRQVRADRPRRDGQRALLLLVQPRRHEVAAPASPRPPSARSPTSCSLMPSTTADRPFATAAAERARPATRSCTTTSPASAPPRHSRTPRPPPPRTGLRSQRRERSARRGASAALKVDG